MKQTSEILKNITLVGQLGLSLLTPVLLCLFLCMFLQNRFHLGGWIFIPGFILGLGGSMMTAWKFYKAQEAQWKKKKDNTDVSTPPAERGKNTALFNRHF
ncbi:MAG: AtpZ/AtpI family protein [Lachnospiraceae bacterium]|nr:AtpZ/AtpI family protein [Lachnospiraceae bacterium]